MKFTEKGNTEHLKGWRFTGNCIDEKTKKNYIFYTNSIYEARQFKEGKEMLGMRFVDGKHNDNYKVIRKLLEK